MIVNNDCLSTMKSYQDNYVSCIVTDPPYGLSFMNKEWDKGIPGIEYWKEALRITKPGGHLLAFGGTRTYHRLTCTIEDAGWEIRDNLCWLYGSGFPKSHNHFGIEGYGTALKPAWEPIIMAMKPCDGTFKQNVDKWNQAGINIDECRIGNEIRFNPPTIKGKSNALGSFENCKGNGSNVCGRWPANILLDEEAANMLDEQSGMLKTGGGDKGNKTQDGGYGKKYRYVQRIVTPSSGGASRFFYCAKASPSERNEGLDSLPEQSNMRVNGPRESEKAKFNTKVKNNHPTVKPLKLMEYLVKLVMPPKDGLLLDPFAGSGTTILAAKNLGFDAIGIELNKEYCTIAESRLNQKKKEDDLYYKTI